MSVFNIKKFSVRLLFLSLVLLFFSLPVFASGKKDSEKEAEVTLVQVDKEIENSNYTKALELVSRYIELCPEDFEQAEIRINRIMALKEDYNRLESELIELATNNPDDAEGNYQLVLQLEKLEKNPSVIHKIVRSEVKNLTQFKALQARFNEIISKAAEYAEQKDYSSAVMEFLTGDELKQPAFDLYWTEFLEEGIDGIIDEEIIQDVSEEIESIKDSVKKYADLQTQLVLTTENFISSIEKRNLNAINQQRDYLISLYEKFAYLRNDVFLAGLSLEDIFQELKEENPDLTDASFLPFACKFIFGLDRQEFSGIMGAMDTQWKLLIEQLKQKLYTAALDYSELYAEIMSDKKLFEDSAIYSDGREKILVTKNLAEIALEINGLYSIVYKNSTEFQGGTHEGFSESMTSIIRLADSSVALFDEIELLDSENIKALAFVRPENEADSIRNEDDTYASLLMESAAYFGEHTARLREMEQEKLLQEFIQEHGGYKKKPDDESVRQAELLERVQKALMETDADQDDAENVSEEDADGENKDKKSSEEEKSSVREESKPEDAGKYSWDKAYIAFIDAVENAVVKSETSASLMWKKIISFYATGAENIYTEYRKNLDEIIALIPVTAADEEKLPQNPRECIVQVQNYQKIIPEQKEIVERTLRYISEGEKYSHAFMNERISLEQYVNATAALVEEADKLYDRAKKQLQNALFTENEGDMRYAQAEQALKKSDFEAARRFIVQARNKYSEALALQINPELEKESDIKLVNLAEKITQAENEIVVREVRKMKNAVKKAYYAGEFEYAETLVVQAENRWYITNVDPDIELENLKALVNTALSMKVGRVLSVSSPLYPEMSQILSLSNQYYQEGEKLMKQKKKKQASEVLNNAQEKLNALKLVFPLNQEASLLSLMIDKLLDPDEFNAKFKQKIEDAKVNYKSAEQGLKRQAYSDLEDLYEINPDYPGLKQLIYDVKIELGMIPKPVDNTAKINSEKFAKEAEILLKNAGKDRSKIMAAKEKALAAMELNSENELAITVLDEIALKTGGQAAVVLSAEDEELYQRAILALQKNNIIAANTIVTQLMSKPLNSRSAKIIELQRKVQSLL